MSVFDSSVKQVHGRAAHDAAATGNPVAIGGKAQTSVPAAVANDDAVWALLDKHGRQVVIHGAPIDKWINGNSGQITGTTATEVIAAQGAGVRIYITDIMVTNGDADVGTLVTIQDGAGTPVKLWEGYAAKGGGGFTVHLQTPIAATANTAVNAICGTTSAEVYVSISGFAAP